MEDEPRALFEFNDGPVEMMRINADGRFFVKGKEVETDTEIRDTLVEFTRLLNPARLNAAEAALEFYATPGNWDNDGVCGNYESEGVWLNDGGGTAQAYFDQFPARQGV